MNQLWSIVRPTSPTILNRWRLIGWCWALVIGSTLLMPVVSYAQAFSNNDRFYLFYNSYRNQLENQRLQRFQQNFVQDFDRYRQLQNRRYESITQRPEDDVNALIRQGRYNTLRRRPLPSIYNGGYGRNRQYFQRIDYFNPPQRFGIN